MSATTRGQGTALIVLGMHESGTSAMAGVLHHLGADAPLHLMEPSPTSHLGYGECDSACAFDDGALASHAVERTDWMPADDSWLRTESTADLIREVGPLVKSEFGESQLFVLQDPRLSRLTTLWLEGLARLAIESKAVIMLRNPMETARSLHRRNGIALEDGLLIWLRYLLDAEKNTRDTSRVFVSYEDLLSDWHKTSERIMNELGVVWPRSPGVPAAEIEKFLAPSLRHHTDVIADLDSQSRIGPLVARAYEVLLGFCEDENRADALAVLDGIRENFATGFQESGDIPVGARVDPSRVSHSTDEPGAESEVLRVRVSELEAELAGVREESEALRGILDKTEIDNDRLQSSLENRFRELSQMARIVHERDRLLMLREAERDRMILAQTSRHWRLLLASRELLQRTKPRTPSQKRQAATIRSSNYFDSAWYLDQYPDVRAGDTDPARHYVCIGAMQGRDPGPNFSTLGYLISNLDVAKAGENPLLHFIWAGEGEGRSTGVDEKPRYGSLEAAQG